MIPESITIDPNLIVRHDEGLLYQVEDTRLSTVGYEATHQLGNVTVNYVQLQNGGYPAGTKWSKDEAGFRDHFTVLFPDVDASHLSAPIYDGRVDSIYDVPGHPDFVVRVLHASNVTQQNIDERYLAKRKEAFEDMRTFGIAVPYFDFRVRANGESKQRLTIVEKVTGVNLRQALGEQLISISEFEKFVKNWSVYTNAGIEAGSETFSDAGLLNFMYGTTATDSTPRIYLIDIDPASFMTYEGILKSQQESLLDTLAQQKTLYNLAALRKAKQ